MSEFFVPLRKQPKRSTKVTLEQIMRINPFFDEKNPITYKMFLLKRPDLPSDEVTHYTDLIRDLEMDMAEEIHYANIKMRDCRLVFAEQLVIDAADEKSK